MRCDLAIVGAGAAGLAAARIASEHGASATVVEARERIGGRAHTVFEPDSDVPIELGAEFVHGMPEVSARLIAAAGATCLPVGERSFRFDGGALREAEDAFELVARVMARAKDLDRDVSIETFTAGLPEQQRRYARMMVAGFDAADPRLASTLAIAQEWSDQENGQTSSECRLARGYRPLLETLRDAADPEHVGFRFATPVRAIAYGADGVTVHARDARGADVTIEARRAIVTLPLGVLQAGSVAFDPPLDDRKRRALDGLIMGPVVRLVLRFRDAFWEELDGGRYREASFFQGAPEPFGAYWTRYPQRTPLLVAWAGGPNADALATATLDRRTEIALAGLASLFGNCVDLRARLQAVHAHDWQRDPYARGAYSYVAVGAANARESLAAPVAQRLFFAGEATAAAQEAGTVAGALMTGEAAARAALASL